MSAKLVITEGDAVSKEIPIQFSVLRIGSGASCEVQVRGIADVAATLRYDQGRYQVLNRGANPIDLDGSKLDTQQSKLWPHQGQLRLSDQCQLTLVIEGDPAPRNSSSLSIGAMNQIAAMQQPESDPDEEEDPAANEPPPKAKVDPQKAFQLTVVILCVVAGIGLLGFDALRNAGLLPTSSSQTAAVNKDVLCKKFECPVNELLETEKTLLKAKSEDTYFKYVQLREALQEARIADVREDWNVAAFYYREVLEQMEGLHLVPTVEPDEVKKNPKAKMPSLKMPKEEYQKLPLGLQLDIFVRQRLAQIDPKVSKFTDPDA